MYTIYILQKYAGKSFKNQKLLVCYMFKFTHHLCLLVIWISCCVKCSFKSFAHFLLGCLFLIWSSSLYILNIFPLYMNSFWLVFSL